MMKFTEVDDTKIDASSDYWAACETEMHTQHYFNMWAEHAAE